MAIAANPLETFFWGAGGSKKTPEQIAREREIAETLLMKAGNTSPVGHWTQGAARVVDALSGVVKNNRADAAETAGREGFQTQWDSVFGGSGAPVQTASIDPIAQALTGQPQTASDAAEMMAGASVPSGDTAGYIRQGLIQRGLPEHVADAFLMNMQDESGLNPGINEAKPLVPGSRGGYGLYQLTGPRRRAYEAYAQQNGIPLDSVDGQLDFMMSELAGPEANAYQSIMAAPDTGSAAAAIVNNFLRPAEEHRARRVAQYTGGSGNQVAQALMGGGGGQGGGQPSMQQLMGLASDPWASDAQKSIVQSLLGQQMQQQDPAYQLDMQLKQAQLAAATAPPAAPKPVYEGGQWWDLSNGGPQALTDAASDPTSGMQNYEYLVSQGVDAATAMERAFGAGGVSVTLGDQGQRTGPIPAGMAAVADPSNPSGFRMEPIPGGPVAQATEAAAAAQAAGQEATGRTNNIVREDLGRIKDIVQSAPWYNPAVGFGAKVASAIEGSNATNVAALSKTVLANIGFDRLQQMREASPTGGALGAISDRELGTLQSVMGNLEQSQSIEQFVYNLDRLGQVYEEISAKASAYPNAGGFGFTGPVAEQGTKSNYDYNAETPPEGWSGDTGLWRFMSPEDRALW